MRFPPIPIPLLLLAACGGGHRPVQQTTVTVLREQRALTLPPELPMGMGAPMSGGSASLTLGGGLVFANQPGTDAPGQHVLPLQGLARGAAASNDWMEFTASGSIASPDVSLGALSANADALSGYLARGTMGMRFFPPFDGPVKWGFSFDLGAEASHVSRTDTVSTEVRDRSGTTFHQNASTVHDLRIHPHLRTGSVLRVPTGPGITALAGYEVQTWQSYWTSKEEVEVCTEYRDGDSGCERTGSIRGAPNHVVLVLTPTIGASFRAGDTDIQVQGFANLGDDPVEQVPWGAMLTIERVWGPSMETP